MPKRCFRRLNDDRDEAFVRSKRFEVEPTRPEFFKSLSYKLEPCLLALLERGWKSTPNNSAAGPPTQGTAEIAPFASACAVSLTPAWVDQVRLFAMGTVGH